MPIDMREPSRLRMLNPLRTSAIPAPPQVIPLSATSLTCSAYMQLSASAIQPYNPQEWIGAPPPAQSERLPGGFSHTHSRGLNSSQEVPGAPPPYSPPRTTHPRPVSLGFEPSPANTSAARIPPTRMGTESPQNFPPPPSSRGASRERRFGLPSLSRRREPELPNPMQSPIDGMHGNFRGLSVHIPANGMAGLNIDPEPPSARRAVSTSAIETPHTASRSRSSSQACWEPGMPLPPPPPGPPPSQSRSQSVQSDDRNRPIISPPTRRPPPSGVSALGPVPPTPANWVDETPGVNLQQPHPPPPPMPPVPAGHFAHSASALGIFEALSAASAGGSSSRTNETDSPTVATTSPLARPGSSLDKTIAQRRSESRTRTNSRVELANHQPSDIDIPSTTSLSRSGATRTTPRSGKFGDTTPRTGELARSGEPLRVDTSTPSSSKRIDKLMAQTPPVRPAASSRIATPDASQSTGLLAAKQKAISQTADQFSHDTIERFQIFAMKEAAAATDAERVRMFADFFVNESRIRRERYANAISIMGSEIFDLSRDLFRPMATRRLSSVSRGDWTPGSSAMQSTTTNNTNFRDSMQSNSVSTPASAAATSSLPPSPGPPASNQQWQTNGFMPSLSPILSMSIADDCDSRGRPASRWWEAGSQGRVEGRMERSKRESKYMGVPKEAREALQWEDDPQVSNPFDAGSSQVSAEYPPEKVGLHDDNMSTPQHNRFSMSSLLTSSQPSTPNTALSVDVSRLVTLPPPYPRHHPAVNNNHPDLTDIRTQVRTLTDMTENTTTTERFTANSIKMRENLVKEQADTRKQLLHNLQSMINSGEMTYMDAGAIEKDHQEVERAKTKELDKKDFENFQRQVVLPLNDVLTTRIDTATQLLNNLATGLFDNDNAADLPQEEGDDKPELLEKLTLLKWIFEAREALHKEIFDLLSDRNDRYRDVVLAPYRASNNTEKLRSTETFFRNDAATRQRAFAIEVRDRTLEFLYVVENNVMRGCEVQLNAFWDIAPPLRRILDKVPTSPSGLGSFRIQIPAAEYAENPVYYEHPMQYLFSLLLHAEKSTYQFIESQTNMLCLLHQIKEASAHARAEAVEAEATNGEETEAEGKKKAERFLAEEMEVLNGDLREKVKTVQEQWRSGFGEVVVAVKERVGEYLLETGGWDEQLEEGGLAVGVS